MQRDNCKNREHSERDNPSKAHRTMHYLLTAGIMAVAGPLLHYRADDLISSNPWFLESPKQHTIKVL